MITIRSLVYTSRAAEWHALLRDLGFTQHESDGADWTVFASSGLIAVHAVPAGDPLDGQVELQTLVDDLDETIAGIESLGITVDREILDDGATPLARVHADNGVRVSVLPGAVKTGGSVVVQPIWYRRSAPEGRALLTALGLQPRLASDAGTWLDFSADAGGRAALHEGDSPGIELSLEVAQPDRLAAQLRDRGRSATVVDEAYNRTVLVPSPDGGELWVNGPIDDLYGYHRLDVAE
ncbi:hypothetical protein EV141_0156 [Microcella putealis]|uniref:VOC domain-containing protein n=1 Tax=Microcella putealis TaxID=337005 RepID=A0A4Q7LWK0_9MICO|nr:hypothetical protein [Microcella putealis]RZS58943.1 hypothetical protein EV141_0156 [Microcella putealis]TQM23969.1 hypothetical protein BJ957_1435 [Microcella putealis]